MYREILMDARLAQERVAELYEKRFYYVQLGTAHTATKEEQVQWLKKARAVEKQIAVEVKRGKIACSNAEIVIALLTTLRLRKIFYMRYVLNYEWRAIAAKMKKENKELRVSSKKKVLYLHDIALRYLDKIECNTD